MVGVLKVPRKIALACVAAMLASVALGAQSAPAAGSSCLVTPFENRSETAGLDWIGASFAVSLRRAVEGDGIQVLDHAQQEQARKLVGAPEGAALSMATQMKMAETAGAGWLLRGWYDYDGETITIQAGLLNLEREHWVELAPTSGKLEQLEQLEQELDWAVRQRMLPGGAGETAKAATGTAMPLAAYERYVRAEGTANAADRIRLLLAAEHVAPSEARVEAGLGQAYFELGHDDAALYWLSRVKEPEAQFTAAVAAYHLGRYGQATELLRPLAATMPVEAVVHNLAMAEAAEKGHKGKEKLETAFPAAGFRELGAAMQQFRAQRDAAAAAGADAAGELTRAQGMQKQGALESALQIYRAVAEGAEASTHQKAEAHAGMAEIAWARHDAAGAKKEAAAALAAEADNARAQAIAKQVAAGHRS